MAQQPAPDDGGHGDPDATINQETLNQSAEQNRLDQAISEAKTHVDPRDGEPAGDADVTLESESTIEADTERTIEQQWRDTFTEQTTPELTIKSDPDQTVAQTFAFTLKSREVSRDGASVGNPDYVREELLGEGGMGAVYSARQKSIDRMVAIKVLKARSARRESSRDAFVAEAMITGELDHPNIVPVYDLGLEEDATPFYVMKQVQGVEWADRIAENSLRENLDILMRVADAISLAHARGIVHRDLKPANIMLGEFGEVLVMDWGLAVPAPDSPKRHRFPKPRFGGTPCYMAPEMANGPIQKVDRRSDIYLLGAILFQILTGSSPHPQKTVKECLRAAAENEIAPTDESGLLMDIAMQAMSTSPDDRYQSVREFDSAVQEYFDHLESISLAEHGGDGLKKARQTDDYDDYARAVVAFEQAHELWPGNDAAKAGVSAARLSYAESALRKSDHELCGSLLNSADVAHAELQRKLDADIAEKRRTDEERATRLRRVQRLSYGLAGVVAVTMAVAIVWINSERNLALLAQEDEARQRRLAEENLTEARLQKANADRAALAEQQARETAQTNFEAAEEQRQLAVAERNNADRQLYLNHIQFAQREWDTHNAPSAWIHLNATQERLRGWEYRYLKALFTRDSEVVAAHNGHAIAVRVSPDDRLILTAGSDRMLKLWATDTLKEVRRFKGHTKTILSAAFSPDGTHIASGSEDKTVRVWNVETGQQVMLLEGHTRAVRSVAFSPDGIHIASGSSDQSVRIWEADTGRQVRVLKGHTSSVTSVDFSPAGNLVSGSWDHTIRIWDVETGQSKLTLTNDSPVDCVAFSPDGSLVASGDRNFRAKIWDASTGELKQRLRGHGNLVYSVAFSRDGLRLLTGSQDGTARLWDARSGNIFRTLTGHLKRVRAAAFSKSENWIVTCATEGSLRFWPNDQPDHAALRSHSDSVNCVAFSRDGDRIISGSDDTTLRLSNAITGEEIQTLVGHTGEVLACSFSPDGTRIISASVDKSVKLWDAATGKVIRTLREHTGTVRAAEFSPDSESILSAGDDGTIKMWDAATGTRTREFTGHEGRVQAATFAPNGLQFASGGTDKTVRLWNVLTGEEVGSLKGHSELVYCLAFSPDGARLVSGSSDDTAVVWDTETGQELARLIGHAHYIADVHFSPDGSRIITASDDETLKVWHAETGEELTTLVGHRTGVYACDISPDGSRIVSGTYDGSIRFWDSMDDAESRRRIRRLGPAERDVVEDHRFLARQAEANKDWYATAFHLGMLTRLSPDDLPLNARLTNARTLLQNDGRQMPEILPDAVVFNSLGISYSRLLGTEPLPDAELQLRDSLARNESDDPNSEASCRIRALLGAALYARSDFDAAIDCLSEAVERQRSNDCTALLLLALAHHRLMQPEPAGTFYDRAIVCLQEQVANATQRRLVIEAMTEIERLSVVDADMRLIQLESSAEFQNLAEELSAAIATGSATSGRYFNFATLKLHTGHPKTYRDICQEILERFSETNSLITAEGVARTCLLSPEPHEQLDDLVRLAEFAVTEGRNHPFVEFIRTTHGLALFRAARYEEALERLRANQPRADRRKWLAERNRFLLAMVLHQTDQLEEARDEYAAALKLYESHFSDPQRPKRSEFGSSGWHDGLITSIVRNEAQALLYDSQVRAE